MAVTPILEAFKCELLHEILPEIFCEYSGKVSKKKCAGEGTRSLYTHHTISVLSILEL